MLTIMSIVMFLDTFLFFKKPPHTSNVNGHVTAYTTPLTDNVKLLHNFEKRLFMKLCLYEFLFLFCFYNHLECMEMLKTVIVTVMKSNQTIYKYIIKLI